MTWSRFASVLGVVLLLGACARVLGLRASVADPFPHRAHVTEGIPCTRCHEGILSAPDYGPLHLPTQERCLECHEEPHDERRCADCHSLDRTEARLAMAKEHLRFAHAEHLPEVGGNCARCHQNVAVDEATILPPMAACISCHEHKDTFELADCDGCHVDLVEEVVRPRSHLVHEEDYLRRHREEAAANQALCETCHSQTQCAECHGTNVAFLPQRRDFSQPTLSGLHRAGFRSRHAREAAADRGLCVTCHTEQSCQRCHADSGLAAVDGALVNPHPPGWVSAGAGGNAHGLAARRDPVSCASCHGGAGEQLCVSCHRVGGVGGSIHPPGFDSERNARTEQPCRMCHL